MCVTMLNRLLQYKSNKRGGWALFFPLENLKVAQQVEAIALRLEAIATRVEAIATRFLKGPSLLGWRPSLLGSLKFLF